MRVFLSLLLVAAVVILAINLLRSQKPESPQATQPEVAVPSETQAQLTPTPHGQEFSAQGPSNTSSVVEDQKKIEVLNEILKSKNDNDPRLDTQFNNLSDNAKQMMRDEYKAMKPERFNDKGTVVFLLGRNLTNARDYKFLGDVLSEPPCNNLDNCAAPKHKSNDPEASHLESVNSVTLNYPQIVSLKSLESALEKNPTDPEIKNSILEDLRIAADSKSPMISRMARQILERQSGQNGPQ